MCRRRLSRTTVIIDNIPTVTLWILTTILLLQFNLIFTVLFWIYVPFSVLWFWRFICTYCTHFGTACCPCGYATGAAKLFLFRDETKFRKAFNSNIAIVFPYWLVPLIAGGYLLYTSYPDISYFILAIYILALIDGFVIVPLVSKKVGCKKCPTRDECPWFAEGKKPMEHII